MFGELMLLIPQHSVKSRKEAPHRPFGALPHCDGEAFGGLAAFPKASLPQRGGACEAGGGALPVLWHIEAYGTGCPIDLAALGHFPAAVGKLLTTADLAQPKPGGRSMADPACQDARQQLAVGQAEAGRPFDGRSGASGRAAAVGCRPCRQKTGTARAIPDGGPED